MWNPEMKMSFSHINFCANQIQFLFKWFHIVKHRQKITQKKPIVITTIMLMLIDLFSPYFALKVQMKVAWNLMGGRITGFTMVDDELSVLHDVYSSAIQSGCQTTSYIVQFLFLL